MRRIIGTIAATLALAIGVLEGQASEALAAPASAGGVQGHSTTMLAEFVPWAQAHDKFTSSHSGGALIGLADGSVRFVTWSVPILPYIEQENLYRQSVADYATVTSITSGFVPWAMGTRSGGEVMTAFRSRHAGGANFSMEDGSVRFIAAQGVSAQTGRNACSPSDGQTLGSDW
jgi:prepilin-type processing-associated H-X9-DG protein